MHTFGEARMWTARKGGMAVPLNSQTIEIRRKSIRLRKSNVLKKKREVDWSLGTKVVGSQQAQAGHR